MVEIHGFIFRPEPVSIAQRRVVDFQQTLQIESSVGEHLHPLDETCRAATIADEIGATRFALEDCSDADRGDVNRAMRVQPRIALQLFA